MTDKVVAYTTCGDPEEAEKIARHLIDERLAACVSVVESVKSYYRWKGRVESDDEILLMIKTSRDLVDAVRQALDKLHTYDLPELIVTPIVDGSPNYLAWLETELADE
jgi:periplasmic divalent cation tolerance protein